MPRDGDNLSFIPAATRDRVSAWHRCLPAYGTTHSEFFVAKAATKGWMRRINTSILTSSGGGDSARDI